MMEMLESLQDYIDKCFHQLVMQKKNQSPLSSKRSREENSSSASSFSKRDKADILDSINKKLTSFDSQLALLEVLHKEFQEL